MTKKCIAGFGEVMLRLSPAGKYRFSQVLPGVMDAKFGGGEANVCASVSMFGMTSRYLTALPDTPIVQSFITQMRGIGVDTSEILLSSTGRMGIYFVEHGSGPRGSSVVYDRSYSTISLLPPEAYDFNAMLDGVTHLHLSGITPSLSENAYLSTLKLAETAHQAGITISVDLNYRKKLWNWNPELTKNQLACQCMTKIVALADIIIGNEEDASDVFEIHADDTSIESGKLNINGYIKVAEKLSEKFAQAKFIAITLRESISADHNNWGGMLYDVANKKANFAPLNAEEVYSPYQIHDIVDRLGGGDSFCAGLLFALNTPELAAPATAIRYAVAASCLKHTINGDFNYSSQKEVEALMKGSASGRVQR